MGNFEEKDKESAEKENKAYEKVPPNIKWLNNKPVLSLILGLIGAALTAVSIIITYNSSKNVSELMLPLLYNFIPFFISFVLIKMGIAGLVERKK